MPILGLFIMFLAVLAILRKRSTQSQTDIEERFWEKERAANHTRLKDLSRLPYITIPLDKFPIGKHENNELKIYEETINFLAGQKIVNLGSKSNTELKLTYGTASLEHLTQYEHNFTVLCQTLVGYAEKLIHLGFRKDAQTVLEYGISIGSDLSKNYLLLAKLYRKNGEPQRINELIDSAQKLDSLLKPSIIKKLSDMLSDS